MLRDLNNAALFLGNGDGGDSDALRTRKFALEFDCTKVMHRSEIFSFSTSSLTPQQNAIDSSNDPRTSNLAEFRSLRN